jgi:hypothetical protein
LSHASRAIAQHAYARPEPQKSIAARGDGDGRHAAGKRREREQVAGVKRAQR